MCIRDSLFGGETAELATLEKTTIAAVAAAFFGELAAGFTTHGTCHDLFLFDSIQYQDQLSALYAASIQRAFQFYLRSGGQLCQLGGKRSARLYRQLAFHLPGLGCHCLTAAVQDHRFGNRHPRRTVTQSVNLD